MTTNPIAAIAALKARGLESLPRLAIVLGSGLGPLADEVSNPIAIPYADIPGFPTPTVAGHAGRLVVGEIEGKRVALFQGRGHYYERGDVNAMRGAIETFRALGGDTLILTNAAGGLNIDWAPPSLVAITDHINFAGANPLIGAEGGDRRFVPLTNAYDRALRARLHLAAEAEGVDLHDGVYMWFSGPSFENSGRDSRGEDCRRRSRRHVDRPGSHSRPLLRPALRGRLSRDELCGGPLRRRSEPRGDAGIRAPRIGSIPPATARLYPRRRMREVAIVIRPGARSSSS